MNVNELTDEDIENHKRNIDHMTKDELIKLWQSAPPGHIYFHAELPLYDYLEARLESLGEFVGLDNSGQLS